MEVVKVERGQAERRLVGQYAARGENKSSLSQLQLASLDFKASGNGEAGKRGADCCWGQQQWVGRLRGAKLNSPRSLFERNVFQKNSYPSKNHFEPSFGINFCGLSWLWRAPKWCGFPVAISNHFQTLSMNKSSSTPSNHFELSTSRDSNVIEHLKKEIVAIESWRLQILKSKPK